MILQDFKIALEEQLTSISGKAVSIISNQPVGGGCINRTLKLNTTEGAFFIKLNDACLYPGMFDAEMQGLKLLAGKSALNIPVPLISDEFNNTAFLLMEFIGQAPPEKNFWENYGASLAALHKNTYTKFGLDISNYIGSLPQQNSYCDSWAEFFSTQRLGPLCESACRKQLLPSNLMAHFERLYARLPEIFPDEPAALLHGDLWNGNYMVDDKGKACLIDPAVYYGHREMDLGMSKLFGGFSPEFYASYHNAYPLEKGWQERTEICNLYPLLVHLILFGRSYLWDIERVVKKFEV